MTRLIFIARSLEDRKKIVEFWNPYCKKFNEYSGTCDNYAVDYDSNYIITGYYANSDIAILKSVEAQIKIFPTIPDFMDFPKRVRDKMIERSAAHSPIPFLSTVSADVSGGGFLWSDSAEGHEFWNEVVRARNFDLFDKRFNFNSKDHESKLCNKGTPFRGDSGENYSGIRSRFNKARITVKSLGYQKVVGRG